MLIGQLVAAQEKVRRQKGFYGKVNALRLSYNILLHGSKLIEDS